MRPLRDRILFASWCNNKFVLLSVFMKRTIEARKKSNLTQHELSEKSGIIQPSIAKIESFVRTPQYTTLMKLLYPMGYTLRVVPLKKRNKRRLIKKSQ